VFFEFGSEMQMATALVVNVLQLCVQIYVQPFGDKEAPGEAALLNMMQTLTLVLTSFITIGASTLNALEVSKALARYADPDSVGLYELPSVFVAYTMQVLTAFVLLTFAWNCGGKDVSASRLYAACARAPALYFLSHRTRD